MNDVEAPRGAFLVFPSGTRIGLALVYAGIHRGLHVYDVRRLDGRIVPSRWVDGMGGALVVEYVPPNTRIRMETIR